MRVPVEWLSEYVETGSAVDELADSLTMVGLEVEEIEHLRADEIVQMGGAADGSDDRVLMTKVTPNRGDWLSILGVAREVAAVSCKDLQMPDPKAEGNAPDAQSLIRISITAPDLCYRYAGMVIRNIKIGPSPDWMKNRLIRAGMRPINNIVDITNYVMLELGQPLHAFDCDILAGQEIIVRRANPGEKISTIDDVERKLTPDMLVIADRDNAVAVAGVMGGLQSEVTGNTKNILLESANFDAVSVRRTSKTLGLVTESSYRFERGVDPGITALAARRAAELMRDLAGGEIAEGIIDVFPGEAPPRKIVARPDRANWLLDTELDAPTMISFIRRLGFAAELVGDSIEVTVPTHRPDVVQEVDVIEEIARIYGYENLKSTLLSTPMQGKDSEAGAFVERLRGMLMACGIQEVLTHTLTDMRNVEVTGLGDVSLLVRNQLSEETSHVRVMLSPNLLQAIARNQSNGIRDLGIFEIGKVDRWNPDGTVNESCSAAAAMVGSQWAGMWNLSKDALVADFFLVKGALEAILSRLDLDDVTFSPVEHPLLHPTRAAKVMVGSSEIGIIGEVAPSVIESYDLRGRPCIFEFSVDALRPLVPLAVGYKHLPKFPALYRHMAVVANRSVPYATIERVIFDAGGEITQGVELQDVYTGEQVESDECSLTLSITFRAINRTLTDDEVGTVLGNIKSALISEFGAKFRG